MANGLDEFNLQLKAEIDKSQSKKNIESDIHSLESIIEHLKVQAEIDPNSVKNIAQQLSNIMNQKIVVDNIQVDVSKSSKSTQEAGRKITDNIANSIKANKASIESAITDLNKNALNGLVSKFNLGSKNADPKISQDVNKLTKELNALAEQAVRTNSDSSWEGIVNKMSELQSILSSVGKVRVDLSSYDEIIKVTDYFSGMNIKIPAENVKEVLSSLSLSGIDVLNKKGSIENLKDLNQQLVQLGITFSRGKSNLNGDWESIFSDLGRADLVGVTNNVDQYVKLINELLLAREKMYGGGSLRPASSTDISNVLLEWLENVENTYKRVAVLYDEQNQLQNQLSQTSDNSTDKLVKDEQRKRSEFQETARELSKLEEYYKKYFEAASNSDKALQQHLKNAREQIIKQLTEYNPAKGIDGNLPLGFTDTAGVTQQNLDYYEAMNAELSKLRYTLGEIQWSDSSYSARAKIIPIDENAIKDATEMRNILYGIKNQTEDLAKSSTDSADTIVKNEKKKQDAYKQTANAQKHSLDNPDLDISENEKKIEQFKESLEELGTVDSKYVDKLSGRFEKLGIQIQSINASLSEVAVHEKGEYKGTKEILSTTLRGLDKNGQAITLMESWDLTNHEFVKSLDGVGASFENVSKYITDYQIKLNNLKTKYSNLDMDYSGFEEMLSNFGKGIGTIDDLRLAFNNLENTAKSSVQSLKSQTSSFDPIQQTLNNMRDLPSMLTALEANMSGVKDKTSIAEISVDKLRESFDRLDAEMQSNGGKVPITDEWLKNYRDLMSTVTSATKQVDALKKAEASDNSQTQKQANYYSTILSNYREIYSLKQKLLTAGKEETKVIQEQIRSLNSSNASINKQLGKQGLKDSGWQTQVDDLKEELDYSLRISEARQKDKVNQSSLNNAQREAIQIVEELEQAYQRVQDIKIKIASLDKAKDGEKISTLSQEEESAQAEYKQLYDRLRKRKNYDKESWNETKSAIDSATQSAIEYNNSRAQDTLNKAQKTEVANFNILKNKWEEQGVLVGEFKEKVEAMESSLASVGSKGELDNLKLQIKDLKTEADKIAKVNEIQHLFANEYGASEYGNQIRKIEDDLKKYGVSAERVNSIVKDLNDTLADFKVDGKLDGEFIDSDKLITQADLLESKIKSVDTVINEAKISYDKFMQPVAKEKASSLIIRINDFLYKNTNITKEAKDELQSFITKINGGVNLNEWNAFDKRLKEIKIEMGQMNRLGNSLLQTFKQNIKKFAEWAIASASITEVIHGIKSMMSTVAELDTALVDLTKTANMSSKELEDFYYASNDVAKQMGVTTKEIIDQASAWSRLGFNTAETATQMAKLSSMFKLISPGMTSDEATSGLVSIMKAYGLEVDDVLDGIMSKVNVVGNKFALSNSDIIAMLQDSVSAMAEGNNTLEETIALETAAFEIAQDRSVGNGFKTVALRLRGINEETQELDDSLKTISGDLYDLTGVSVMQDADTYKSTYQILKDMYDVWDDLSDKKQAEALELMFGKQRANVGAAVLQNFEAAEKAMDEMAQSAGNAEAEMSIAMDSIEYKINILGETGTAVAQNLFGREDMKTVLDGINMLGSAIEWLSDKLGLFGTIGLSGGIFAGFKNVGEGKMLPSICFE